MKHLTVKSFTEKSKQMRKSTSGMETWIKRLLVTGHLHTNKSVTDAHLKCSACRWYPTNWTHSAQVLICLPLPLAPSHRWNHKESPGRHTMFNIYHVRTMKVWQQPDPVSFEQWVCNLQVLPHTSISASCILLSPNVADIPTIEVTQRQWKMTGTDWSQKVFQVIASNDTVDSVFRGW